MPDALTTGLAVRAVLWAIIAALLVRHVHRFRASLAATVGSRFPTLYWCFAAFLGLAALEAAVATIAPVSTLRIGLGMSSDLSAIVTIDRLWRSQAESGQRWQTPEGIAELRRAVDAIEQFVAQRRGASRG